uniref:Transposase n=1 Tax=Panagrellus redivivus TaxID=6233 RepID=A0A7E4V413_PANRE
MGVTKLKSDYETVRYQCLFIDAHFNASAKNVTYTRVRLVEEQLFVALNTLLVELPESLRPTKVIRPKVLSKSATSS